MWIFVYMHTCYKPNDCRVLVSTVNMGSINSTTAHTNKIPTLKTTITRAEFVLFE